jgi:catechol 2,3-dioxygenase-like lactoylglutathione lyase family enzyme
MSGELVAFVATVDLDRAAAFYEDVLGLLRTDRSDFAAVFDVNGTQLRVTKVEDIAPAPYTVLGWRVEDIHSRIGELRQRGVVFLTYAWIDQDEDGVWTAPGGTRVAWFSDPDGNTLSLQEEAPV